MGHSIRLFYGNKDKMVSEYQCITSSVSPPTFSSKARQMYLYILSLGLPIIYMSPFHREISRERSRCSSLVVVTHG